MKKTLKAALSVVLAIVLTFGSFAGLFGNVGFVVTSSAAGRTVVKSGSYWTFFDDGELFITGDIPSFSKENPAPWKDYIGQIKLVSLADEGENPSEPGVKSIGSLAFEGIGGGEYKVKTIYVPGSVNEIKTDAFDNFDSLEIIYFGASMDKWDFEYQGEGIRIITHTHSTGEVKNAVAADCKNNGYLGDTYCKVCHSLIKLGTETPNDNTKHRWSTDLLVKDEPTCKDDGTRAYQCVICGAWKSDATVAIPATGRHEMVLLDENKIEDCSKSGKVKYTCKYCDYAEQVEINAHSYLYQVTDPTCTQKGYTTVTCKYCKYNAVKDYTDPLDHDASIPFNEPATCTATGRHGYRCSRCGEICDIVKDAALGHDYSVWVVTKDPTCTVKGEKELRCSRCNDVKEKAEVDTLHTEGSREGKWYVSIAPTCVNDGVMYFKCNVCGEDVKDAEGKNITRTIDKVPNSHSASRWVTVIEPTCTEPGLKVKKCTVPACPYHSDSETETGKAVTAAIDKASDDSVTKTILTTVDEALVEQINDSVLNSYYQLKDPNKTEIKALIDTNIKNKNIVWPDEDAKNLADQIITLAVKNIAEDASVNNTVKSINAYFNAAFTAIGDAWISEALSHATSDDIDLIKHMTLDQEVIAANGHSYQVASYYEEIIAGESVYTTVTEIDGKYFPVLNYVLVKDEDGEIIYDRKGNPVYAPVPDRGENDENAVDTEIHKIITDVDCNVGGTLVKQCPICMEINATKVVKGTHKYAVTIYAPTCTEQGFTQQTCEYCTYCKTYDYLPSIGHKWETQIIKDSTCTKTGLQAKICANCGEIDKNSYEPVTLKAHIYLLETFAPTCTEEGYTQHTCKVCGGGYKDDYVDALGHKLVNKVVEATCTTDGYSIHTCSVCKYEYKDTIVLSEGHNYGTDSKEIAATCTSDSYTQQICKKCGNEKKTNIGANGTALGHLWMNDAEKAPSCETTGLTAGKHCDRCGYIEIAQEIIPVKEHIVVNDSEVKATCTTSGLTAGTHCSVCKKILTAQEVVPATDHRVVVDKAVAATCEETGLTKGSHCELCNTIFEPQLIVDATGHIWGDTVVAKEAGIFSAGVKARTCQKCGKVVEETYTLTFMQKITKIFTTIFDLIFGFLL